MTESSKTFEVEIFHDGECSACAIQVALLRRRDTDGRLRFVDIAAPEFEAERDAGMPIMRFVDCIQTRLPSGEVIEGVEALRCLHDLVDSQRAMRLTRTTGATRLLDGAYRLFARDRLRVASHCAGQASTAARASR